MAHFLFLSDFEQGHLFPTFGLAHSLIRRGHRVSYIGIPDMEPYVERQGLELYPIYSDLYPAGASAQLRAEAQSGEAPSGVVQGRVFSQHLEPLIQGDLDELMADLAPDLVISSLFLPLETLIFHYRYQLPMAVFTQCLRAPDSAPGQLAVEEIFDLDHLSFQILELAMNQGHEVRSRGA
ncbi:MAG: hypothetical protein SX243_24800, partial [Acidobacteriota bacterium]|nr:hypothetical protein [Acidobacteriota bacterium]